jgi:tight adherence protein C
MPMELWVGVGLIFVALALVGATLGMLVLQRSSPEQKRLRAVAAAGSGSGLIMQTERLAEGFDPKLQKLSKALPRSAKDMTRLRRRLAAAGHYSGEAAIAFSLAELALPFVLGGLVLFLVGGGDGLILGGIAAVLGYLLPGFWLARATTKRKKAIQNGLPDALDLFIVCMEAGSSLDQAIVKASEELEISHPPLAQELRLLTTEIRVGKSRMEAMTNLAKRTGVDDVRSLVAMLVQTDKFGTSIAQALRTHAKNARIKRRQRAEERAGKIGVKLVFPLVFCLFPGVYLVCIGPVVVTIYRNLILT